MMFPEHERQVFGPYHNGKESVYADPLKVFRRLHAQLEGDPNRFIRDTRSPDPHTRTQAKERLVDAATFALDMMPFDPATGQGALVEHIETALRQYLEYMEKKGQRGPRQQTLSPVMVRPVSSAPAVSPMTSMSPSGATFPANVSRSPGPFVRAPGGQGQ